MSYATLKGKEDFIMKKVLISLLIAGVTLTACACGNTAQPNSSANTNDTVVTDVEQEDKDKAEEEAEAKEKAEKEAKEKAEKEAKEKAEKEAKEKAEAEAKAKAEEEARLKAEAEAKEEEEFNSAVTLIEVLCIDNGFTYVDVTGDYSTKIIFVNIGMDGVAQEMVVTKSTGMGMDSYYYMEDSVAGMCKTMHETCGYHVQVNLVNDINPDNVLLGVLDGSVIYSYMYE